MNILGLDIGGSSIKFGVINFYRDSLTIKSFDKLDIGFANSIEDYIDGISFLINSYCDEYILGICFPSIVKNGEIITRKFDYQTVWDIIKKKFCHENKFLISIMNDADAAGYAEVWRNDASELRQGTTVLITLGTSIGSALFYNGTLFPNTEFAFLRMHGNWADEYVAPSIISKENLSTNEWVSRLNEYIADLEKVLSPDNIIIGGGISTDFSVYSGFIRTKRAIVKPAYYKNSAGVIGVATNAYQKFSE